MAKTFIDIKKNEKKLDDNMIINYESIYYTKRNLNKILFGRYNNHSKI